MNEFEEKRQRFLQSLHKAIDLILSNGDASYIVCVRMRDSETQKLLTSLMTNWDYHDSEGVLVSATPGMLMDIILEARLDSANPAKIETGQPESKSERIN